MRATSRELVRMLKAYARETLDVWAKERGIDASGLTAPGLVEELADRILDPAAIREALAKTTPEEQIALARLKQVTGQMGPGELVAQLQADGVADPDAVIRRLMARGLLFYDRSFEMYTPRWTLWSGRSQTPYPIPFWVPREVLNRVTPPPDLGRLPLSPLATPPPEVREVPFANVQRDVYLLLHEIRANPIKLLKSGDVGKRDSQRLEKVIPRAAAGPGDPTAAAREDGSWFDFLWFLVQRAQLTRVEPGRLLLSEAGEAFLQQSEAAQARALCRAWLDLLAWHELLRAPTLAFETIGFGDVPSPHQVRAARYTLRELLLREQVYPAWYSVDSLIASMRRFRLGFLIPQRSRAGYFAQPRGMSADAIPYVGIFEKGSSPRRYFDKRQDWERVEGAFLKSVLEEPLLWLGLVRLGYRDGELVAFQLTQRGAYALGLLAQEPASPAPSEGARALVVQPNFEVVVYLETAGVPLLVQLDRFAERVRLDRAALYRLTRAALYRGLQDGLTLPQILRTLERHNAGPIPQNVTYTLAEWEQLYQRIRVYRRVTLVEIEGEEELIRLRREPKLAQAREVASGILLVPEDGSLESLGRGVRCFDYAAPLVGVLRFEGGRRFRVPAEATSPRLRHRVLQIADPVAQKAPAAREEARAEGESGELFVLSREKVARAARWWDWEAMLRFLTEAAGQAPASDLAVTLKGWAGALQPAGMASVTVLVAPSAAWMDEVMRLPEAARLILRRLSPTLALVMERDRPRLEALLSELGVSVRSDADVDEMLSAATKADEEAGETLLVGPPRKRRALMEQAIAQKRQLVIAQMPYGGSRLDLTTLLPLRIEGEGASAYLYGKLPGARYEYSYPLNRIVGVRMTNDSGE